jgi:DNA-directed RNA polymerase subunit RPC12/RpoP
LYCPSCGRQIPDDANICPYCGFQVRVFLQQPHPTAKPPPSRPVTLTIAAILLAVFGFLDLLSGAYFLIVGLVLAGVGGSVPIFGPIFGALSLLVLPYAVLTLILSILLMLSAYWLWNLRKSGGTLAIVSIIVDMLMGLIGLAVLGLAYAPMAVIGFIINITILLLIALSWSSLT